MRAGLPVVATDIGATPDFVIDEETGYRVASGDVTALADRLNALLANPSKCRRMGQWGQALVHSRYTWQRTQRQMWLTIRQRLGLLATAANAPAVPQAANAGPAESTTNPRVREAPLR